MKNKIYVNLNKENNVLSKIICLLKRKHKVFFKNLINWTKIKNMSVGSRFVAPAQYD